MIGVWLAALTFHLICKWLLMNNLQDKNMQLNTGANTTHVTNEWKNTLCKGMGGFTIGDERYLYIWLSLWGSFRYGILFYVEQISPLSKSSSAGGNASLFADELISIWIYTSFSLTMNIYHLSNVCDMMVPWYPSGDSTINYIIIFRTQKKKCIASIQNQSTHKWKKRHTKTVLCHAEWKDF